MFINGEKMEAAARRQPPKCYLCDTRHPAPAMSDCNAILGQKLSAAQAEIERLKHQIRAEQRLRNEHWDSYMDHKCQVWLLAEEIKRLTGLLKERGGHEPNCLSLRPRKETGWATCNCGWDAIADALKVKP